jgi:CRISPR-associated protein Cmr2
VKYIGLTIGPVYKTLGMAKRTRDTWTASYLFSFIMKTLIKQLAVQGIETDKILIPNIGSLKDTGNTGNKIHAGLFPDRLIFRAAEGDFARLTAVVEATMKIIAAGISKKISAPEDLVRRDLDNYLQIYFLEKELDPGDNPILKLSPYLDALERHSKYIHQDSNQTIPRFLKCKMEDFLTRDAGLKESFASLLEISTRELRKVNEKAYDKIRQTYLFNDDKDEEETSFVQALKSNEDFNKKFKFYHKYIAIVQADGDNIRAAIKTCGSDFEALKTFSGNLTAFAYEAARLIQGYGGTPVYAGGDDLLFFAPVVNRSRKENVATSVENLFDLIDKLDIVFKRKFPDATLSYGISITYYKFPLNEAMEEARGQLQHAKQYKDNGREKNAAAFKILKHSGRSFGTIFYKEIIEQKPKPTTEERKQHKEKRKIYTLFKDLLSDYGASKKYLNSIVQSLQTHRGIFKELFENVKDEAVERVEHFFENSFDEPVHDDYRQYIKDAAELVYKVYNTNPSPGNEEQKFQAVYAVLRTLHFFNREDNERQ